MIVERANDTVGNHKKKKQHDVPSNKCVAHRRSSPFGELTTSDVDASVWRWFYSQPRVPVDGALFYWTCLLALTYLRQGCETLGPVDWFVPVQAPSTLRPTSHPLASPFCRRRSGRPERVDLAAGREWIKRTCNLVYRCVRSCFLDTLLCTSFSLQRNYKGWNLFSGVFFFWKKSEIFSFTSLRPLSRAFIFEDSFL